MKSIIQDRKECYITHNTTHLQEHHIFYGTANRKLSEKYGLKVYLIDELHNMSDFGVHGKYGKALDTELKQMAQRKAMEYYNWSIADFVRIFGKNYLDEEWEK